MVLAAGRFLVRVSEMNLSYSNLKDPARAYERKPQSYRLSDDCVSLILSRIFDLGITTNYVS